jgi:hypothetical protein
VVDKAFAPGRKAPTRVPVVATSLSDVMLLGACQVTDAAFAENERAIEAIAVRIVLVGFMGGVGLVYEGVFSVFF